jgi:hypothetical protein
MEIFMLTAVVSRVNSTAVGRTFCIALLCAGALPTLAQAQPPTIAPRITTTTITLPEALEGATGNFCTWNFCTIGPRLYQAPMADGRTLIGWTDGTGNGHVSRVNGATIEQTFDFAATPVRGLVVHADNSFAVLLLNFVAPIPPGVAQNFMALSLLTASGATQWTTSLANTTAPIGTVPGAFPNPPTFGDTGIGDSRLGYGGGMYGAYFSVFANPLNGVSHDGDQYTIVNDSGAIQAGGWNWGLSHSLAELIDYQPDLARLTAVGVTDCFPSPAMWADTTADGGPTHSIFAGDGNCGGLTAVQLGQMAAVTGGNWLVAFNAQSEAPFTDDLNNAHPAFTGQGVGVVSFNGSYVATPGTWLTTTDPTGIDEFDPVLARIGTSLASNRFLVGWHLQTEGTFNMELITPTAAILSPVEAVSPTVGWGNRDDSLKSRPDGSISWLQGAASATTLQMYRYYEIAPTHDFNGDWMSDILWQNSATGEVDIWLMNGTTIGSGGAVATVGPGWSILGVGDFNGDGKADLLWQNSATGEADIWLMNGTTITSGGAVATLGPTWHVLGVGDFNGDGDADILWQNSATGEVDIWLMNGSTIASGGAIATVGPTWSVLGVGDFNGDGKADILWQNSATGEVDIWLMNGRAIASGGAVASLGPTWSVHGVGDFNGDGKADLLWQNSATGEVDIWLMNGTTVISGGAVATVGPDWSIQGTGKFDTTGRSDILWRQASTGNVDIWLMNGTTVVNSASPGSVTAVGWQIIH